MSTRINPAPQVIYQPCPETEDEIDISELFNKLWFRRKSILAFVFLAAVVALGVMSIAMFANAPVQRYSEILQFNFPTAEKGLYPAGQKFSYNDIVSAKVLSEVYARNKLDEHGIKKDDFIDAISVNPYAENSEFIQKKYQSLLANKKLSRPEIDALEKAYMEELRAAQSRFVRLSLIDNNLSGLDKILTQKVLTDIPYIWSRIAIKELGVLDLKIAGADFYQKGLTEHFEYVQALEYLKDSAKYLTTALNTLVKDDIGGLVKNPKTGLSGSDLQVQLKNLSTFEIEPLFSTVTNLGITRDTEKTLIYLRNTILSLEDQKLVLENKAKNMEQVVVQYDKGNLIKNGQAQAGLNGGLTQLDSSFLDKFTSLIQEKNDQAFKQGLLKQRLALQQKIEDIEGNIIKFKRAEKRLVGKSDDTPEAVK